MKKLLLINPVGQKSGYLLSKFSTFSPLGLAYVAAVTPANWDVKIADENFDPFVYEEADLVAITALTGNINRAYEIAGIYRKQNIKVIIGGIHASMYYDEVLQYADAVVVGEVEGIWEKVINDFENNRLSTKYIGPRIDLTQFNIRPRRELLHPHYLWDSVQTSRGCPFECHFCSVSRYLGKKYRQRKAEDVLDELEDIKSEYIAFVDDNLIGYSAESKTRAKNIFEGMIKRGLEKKWWMQTSINAAEDEELVELAAKAGCMFAFIGFESISKNTLKDMKKEVNLKIGVDNYKRIVNTFHKHGIGILGAFVIGNDFESPDYYKQLANFLVRSGIDIVQISILTPLPGTRLMEQLIQENLLIYQKFPQDWDKYRFSYMVHHPREVEIDTIYIGNNYIKNRLYSFPNYQFRLLKSLLNLRNLTNFNAALKLNQALKKSWQNSHYFEKHAKNFQ
jgi:radical SAM superfamily enzyme YgiQ (UPF0313 family)